MEITMTNRNISFHLPSGYDPLYDSTYMSDHMRQYFRNKLCAMLHDLLRKEQIISLSLMDISNRESDHVDQGASEEFRYNQFAFKEHENHVLREVKEALERIEDGSYGFCEETGDPIGVRRLEAVPQTRYCLKVQEDKEQAHKMWRI
jgi:DnaK suppressor protein